MSVGPLSSVGATVAGTQLAQTSGSDVQRAKQEAASAERNADVSRKADDAAGISQPDGQQHETGERDADGRMPWEIEAARKKAEADEAAGDSAEPKSRDATGARGGQLDVSA